MPKKLLAALSIALFALLLVGTFRTRAPDVAWAKSPSGSTENKKTKQVKCKAGTATPAGKVYAGANGLEACSDDNATPDGRVIVSFDERYASIDGDPTNGSNASGFVRVDQSGASCDTAKKFDASKGKGGSCP